MDRFIAYNTGVSPYQVNPLKAMQDQKVLAAAYTVLQYAENNKSRMKDLEKQYESEDKSVSFTIQQAINTSLEASKMAEKLTSNRKIYDILVSYPDVAKIMEGSFSGINLKDVIGVIKKVAKEFEENTKFIAENPPSEPIEGMLDMFILYGDVADDILIYLSELLKNNEEFIGSLFCQLLDLIGVEQLGPIGSVVNSALDVYSLALSHTENVVNLLKTTTTILKGLGSFVSVIMETLMSVMKTVILSLLNLAIEVSLKALEIQLSIMLNISPIGIIKAALSTKEADTVAKNPNYIKEAVKNIIQKGFSAGKITVSMTDTLNMDKYILTAGSWSNLDLSKLPSDDNNLLDMIPIGKMIKDLAQTAIKMVIDVIMNLISQFFSVFASELGIDPPALLIKIDKGLGILSNLLKAIRSILDSTGDIFAMAADCKGFSDSDGFETVFDELLEAEETMKKVTFDSEIDFVPTDVQAILKRIYDSYYLSLQRYFGHLEKEGMNASPAVETANDYKNIFDKLTELKTR